MKMMTKEPGMAGLEDLTLTELDLSYHTRFAATDSHRFLLDRLFLGRVFR
jgi:hypothetical protein